MKMPERRVCQFHSCSNAPDCGECNNVYNYNSAIDAMLALNPPTTESKIVSCPCQAVKAKWGPIIGREHWNVIAESELPNSIKHWLYESLEAVHKCNHLTTEMVVLPVKEIEKIINDHYQERYENGDHTSEILMQSNKLAEAIVKAMKGGK